MTECPREPSVQTATMLAEVKGRSISLDSLLFGLLGVFLCTLVFEGPLRWGLVISGFPNLLYARDAIPVLSVTALFARAIWSRGWVEPMLATVAGILTFHAVIGLWLGLPPFQVAFGLKIFMYVVYGISMWPIVRERWTAASRTAASMYVLTIGGVTVNYFVGQMPWEGLSYESAFGAATTTRQWWIPGGIPRLPGLTRASFNAAMILGITALISISQLQSVWARVATAVVTLIAIIGTTSKGMLIAFPIAAGWLILSRGGRSGRLLVYLLAGTTLILPLYMVLFQGGAGISGANWPAVIESAAERFSWMWPTAFELIPVHVGWLTGAGLGGIGTPQLFGHSPHQFNAGDNFSIFLILNFGIFGVVYYALPAMTVSAATRRLPAPMAQVYVALLMLSYGYGLSVAMIEETFFAVTWGLCVAVACLPLFGGADEIPPADGGTS